MTTTEKINHLLREKKIPKLKFYDDCGISSAAYSLWHQGKTNPTLKNLEKIAAYLGVPVSEILGDNFNQIPVKEQSPAAGSKPTLEDIKAMVDSTDDPEILRQMWNIVTEKLQNQITKEGNE